MFTLFNKQTANKITVEGQAIIKELQKKTSVTKIKKPKAKSKNQNTKYKFYNFKTLMGDDCNSVYLDSVYSKKYDTTIYLVAVVSKNGSRVVIPYLKWINESYCTQLKQLAISHVNTKYLVIDNWDKITCTFKK